MYYLLQSGVKSQSIIWLLAKQQGDFQGDHAKKKLFITFIGNMDEKTNRKNLDCIRSKGGEGRGVLSS